MYKVLLFKSRRHLCKGSMRPRYQQKVQKNKAEKEKDEIYLCR